MTQTYTPNKHEIETSSGRFLDMENPTAESVYLGDIAHALGNTCRYNGHCSNYYSVAEHAVFVSKRLERKGFSRDIQLAGLHHDDAEAFLGDIPKPLKPLLGKKYEQLTDAIDEVICDALGLPFGPSEFHSEWVKAADNWSLLVEARHLLPSGGRAWPTQTELELSRVVIPDYYLDGVTPRKATQLYLLRHQELMR